MNVLRDAGSAPASDGNRPGQDEFGISRPGNLAPPPNWLAAALHGRFDALPFHVPRRIRRLLTLRWGRWAASERIAFLHVPKTAGTALSGAIRDALLPGRVISGFDRSTFGDFDRFDTVAAHHRRHIYQHATDLPRGAEFLTGHFALSSARAAMPHARMLMLLREPTCRILSQWAYWRARPDDDLESWGAWADRIRLARGSLEAFLADRSVACQTDNAYIRTLLWPHDDIPDGDFIDPAADRRLLQAAGAALSRVSLVDVIENPALQPRLEAWLGHTLNIPVVNVTADMPSHLRTDMTEQYTPAAQALLDHRSRLDIQLWRQVAGRRMNADAAEQLRRNALNRTLARYEALMSGVTEHAVA